MILIGMPCGEMIKSRTAFDLWHLGWYSYHSNATVAMKRSADVAFNRNSLAAEAIERKASHMLFIDGDMAFPPDTLARMLERNKDILGLAANRKKLPLESVVKPLNETDKELPTTLFKAASCGTGMMLIKTDVFKKIPAPWFEFGYDDKGERFSEDVSFCRKAREHGYDIWVDPTIPIRHIGEYLY